MRADIDEFKKESEKPAECSFPARFHWLRKELNISESAVPLPDCSEFEAFRKQMRAKSLSVLYASSYPEHPASLFGHTMIKFNEEKGGEGDLDDAVLTYAAAIRQEVNPFTYVIYGITGNFPGSFEIQKYKYKIMEYTEIENRDIWEFRLNLNQEEIDQLTRHLWEMQKTHFDYYFFNENCAFRVLTLLEAARPGLDLTSGSGMFVFPADVIKSTVNQKDLLSAVIFRSSRLESYRKKAEFLEGSETEILKEILNGRLNAGMKLSAERRAVVYDAAADLYAVQNSEDQKDEKRRENYFRTLERLNLNRGNPGSMSSLKGYSERSMDSNPVYAHSPSQAVLSGGSSSSGRFLDIKYRPVLREFTDPYAGYSLYNQLFFLNTNLRYYEDIRSFRIHEIHFIQMNSLHPAGNLLYRPSWRFDSGVQSLTPEIKSGKNSDRVYGFLNAGLGYSWEPFSGIWRRNLLFYSFLDFRMEESGSFKEHYRAGTKSTLGILMRFTDTFSAHLYFDYRSYFSGQKGFMPELTFASNLLLTSSLALEIFYKKNYYSGWEEELIGLKYYF
ncbi:MAG TPA: DUF4105 domain-containing protein [Leptospiraceae bacterium]|nr:DUF4105 domain-containing protein [Leptospiraceae bacterium]